MPATVSIDVASHLSATAEAVWLRVSTPEGINAELRPVRMHLPRDVEGLRALATASKQAGILISLFGVIPLDWHRLGLESVEPGQGFREVSSSLWMRRWVHVRTIRAAGASCVLRDHVELTPRIGWIAPLAAPIYRAVFRRRHRSLQRHFGGNTID